MHLRLNRNELNQTKIITLSFKEVIKFRYLFGMNLKASNMIESLTQKSYSKNINKTKSYEKQFFIKY